MILTWFTSNTKLSLVFYFITINEAENQYTLKTKHKTLFKLREILLLDGCWIENIRDCPYRTRRVIAMSCGDGKLRNLIGDLKRERGIGNHKLHEGKYMYRMLTMACANAL